MWPRGRKRGARKWREGRAQRRQRLVGVRLDGGGFGEAEHEADTRLYSMTLMHTPSDRVRVAPVKSRRFACSTSPSSLSVPLPSSGGCAPATSARVASLFDHVPVITSRFSSAESGKGAIPFRSIRFDSIPVTVGDRGRMNFCRSANGGEEDLLGGL